MAPDHRNPTRPDRNRLSAVAADDADPMSLVGSYFHGQGGRFHAHQGCVVAEPARGVYLVEFFSWASGGSTQQRLVPIADMDEWLFYDDAEWMHNAYEDVSRRWERERQAAPDVPAPTDDELPQARTIAEAAAEFDRHRETGQIRRPW